MSDVVKDNEPTTEARTVALVCCNTVNGVMCKTPFPTHLMGIDIRNSRSPEVVFCPTCGQQDDNWDMVVL